MKNICKFLIIKVILIDLKQKCSFHNYCIVISIIFIVKVIN